MQTLKIDPEFQALIPPLSADEYTALEASIVAEGCRDAIVTWDGVIIDGHNRYAICTAHGLAFQAAARDFEDRTAALLWIIGNQLARRNLNKHQRGVLVLRRKPLIAERNKENQRGGQGGVLLSQNSVEATDTQKELAAAADMSHDTLHKVEVIERDAPEPIKAAAAAGDISTNRAHELTRQIRKLPEPDRAIAAKLCLDHDAKAAILVRLHKSMGSPQTNGTYEEIIRTGGFHYGDDMQHWCDFKAATVAEIEKGLKSIAKHHAREARKTRQAERAELAQTLPPTVFNVVYADPSWTYSNTGVHGAAEDHYQGMPTPEICDMLKTSNVQIADNAVLFLWVTNPMLIDAMQVVNAWGFEYKTNVAWVKTELVKPGSGFYVRGRHELLFICTRGSMTPLVDVAPPIGSVIHAPVQEHSRKPDEAYTIIERLYPGCQYLEINARRSRDGWHAWGDEIGG